MVHGNKDQQFFEAFSSPVACGVVQHRWKSLKPPHSNSVYDASQCKSIFFQDFTEIAMHVLKGQDSQKKKILSFPWVCELQIPSSTLCNLAMEM